MKEYILRKKKWENDIQQINYRKIEKEKKRYYTIKN